MVVYDNNTGLKIYERYYKNGRLHRDGYKPAMIEYNKDGSISYARYYKNGEFIGMFTCFDNIDS